MLDLQMAVDGVGKLRVRHASGGIGILSGVSFADPGPILRTPNGAEVPIGPSRVMVMVTLAELSTRASRLKRCLHEA